MINLRSIKNIALLVLIANVLSAQLSQTGLVAHYSFNNNFTASVGLNATNNGAIFTTDRFGNSNSAINLSNNSSSNSTNIQYVELPNPGSSFFGNDFTIIFWFKSPPANNGRRMYLLSNDQNGIGSNLNFELNDGNAYYLYWNGVGSPGLYSEALDFYNDNQWHQVVLRRISSSLELYIDMVLKQTASSVSGTVGNNTGNIVLGFNEASVSGYPNLFYPLGFGGDVDDVSFYNVAVPVPNLVNIYSGLIAYFDFNNGLTDETGFGNVASLNKITGNSVDLPVLTYDRFGGCNQAYSFNGNGFIEITPFNSNSPLSTLNYFLNDFTISFWAKSNKQNKRMYAFSLDNSATSNTGNDLNIEFNDSDSPSPALWAYWNGGGSPGITVGNGNQNLYTDDNWHLITMSRDKSNSLISLYVDSILKSTYTDNSNTIGSNVDVINIGHIRQPYATTNYTVFNQYGWEGIIDDIKFYNKVLSQQEISTEYTSNTSNLPLKISNPKVNDNWAIGSDHNITWTSTNSNTINISISSDNGASWQSLASGLTSATNVINNFSWTVSGSAGSVLMKAENSLNCFITPLNIIASQESDCYAWECLLNCGSYTASCASPTNVPRWRDGAGLITFNSEMFLLGGWNPQSPNNCDNSQAFDGSASARSNEVWSTTDGSSWVKERAFTSVTYPNSSPVWEQRHVFASVVHNSEIWVVGGDVNQGHYQNDIWKSSDGVSWTKVGDFPSSPSNLANLPNRTLSLYNEFNGKIWIMGGQTYPAAITSGSNPALAFYNDVYNTTDGITWVRKNDAPWSPRGTYCGNMVFNNKMWVLGGGSYQATYLNDVWSTSDGDNWTKEVDFAPWFGRQYQNVKVFDNKMWVIGGVNPGAPSSIKDASNNLNDVWYSSDGINWYQLAGTPWPHRHAASVEVYNNEMYVMAGNNIPAYIGTSPDGTGPIDAYKLTCTGSDSRISNNSSRQITNAGPDIKIYPNPSIGVVNVDASQLIETSYIVELYSVSGVKLLIKEIEGKKLNVIDDLKLPNGIYFLKLFNNNKQLIKVEKIIYNK